MAASTAYAQIFSRLGLLGSSSSDDGEDDDTDTTNKIVSIATTSGSLIYCSRYESQCLGLWIGWLIVTS